MRPPCKDSEPFRVPDWIGTRAAVLSAWLRSVTKVGPCGLSAVRAAFSAVWDCSAWACCWTARRSACGRSTANQ